MRTTMTVLIVVALAAGTACRRPPAPTLDVVALAAATLPADPLDRTWQAVPEHIAPLLLQDMVEPRLMSPSTAQVRVRALVSGGEIALRLEWLDESADDHPGPGRFPDGAAIQFPERASASAPDPQMGNEGQPVQVAFWRADWQATVNGRGTGIQALYPNASIDHYPFEAQSLEPGSDAQRRMEEVYAPAVGAGNVRGALRTSAVEDLVADGPGTLAPAPSISRGTGVRTPNGWAVVIIRPLPDGLSEGSRTAVAFAVWQGSAGEAGARKMRSGWIPIAVREET
jgi:DMSO reductase family type II enzyme heme b subunit